MHYIQWGGDYHFSVRFQQHIGGFETQLTPSAPFLILTGDIFHTPSPFVRPFLMYCAKNWQKVFVVMGNQEYEIPSDVFKQSVPQYGPILDQVWSMSDHERIMKDAIADVNKAVGDEVLVWCTNTYYDIGDLRIAGVCLWADDYKSSLFDGGVIMGSQEKRELQEKEHAFILQMVDECRAKGLKLVMASHFMPSERIQASLYGEYRSMTPEVYPFKAFCVPKEEVFEAPLVAWVCGHVHHEMNFKINGVPLYVNYTHPIAI
jgi:hypothetical protein